MAGAQVVDDRRAGVLAQDRLGQQRRDEVARDEVARAVDEEAAVGVAVPGDADVGLLGDHALDDVGAVLLDERVGLVVGEAAVHLHAHRDDPAGQPLEQLRRHQPAHAVAGIEDALNGLIDASSMNEKTCSTYAASTSRHVRRPGVAAGGRQRAFWIMSRISPRPASPLSGSASARTILMPLYCDGLCEAVICAPPSSPSLATAKYIMSVAIIP